LLLVFTVLAGCSTPGPERALDDYARAVREKDWARVHELSDRLTRSLLSPEELGAAIEGGAKLPAAQEYVGQRHVFELEDGGQVVLVREEDGWRVERGGVALARTETPEDALRTLFLGVAHGRLDIVRAVIPSRHIQAFSDDAALRAHLDAIAPRVRAAAEALGEGARRAVVDGDGAKLTYAAGKTVVFERERGAWRILDIE
jgi:hypothetical protein